MHDKSLWFCYVLCWFVFEVSCKCMLVNLTYVGHKPGHHWACCWPTTEWFWAINRNIAYNTKVWFFSRDIECHIVDQATLSKPPIRFDWFDVYSGNELTHVGLTLFCRFLPGPIREIEGFATHICVTREIRAVFHDAYMRHQAKMSYCWCVSLFVCLVVSSYYGLIGLQFSVDLVFTLLNQIRIVYICSRPICRVIC